MLGALQRMVFEHPLSAPARGDRAEDEPHAALFEALVCEVHGAALQTAVVASIANGISRGTTFHTFAAVEPFLPAGTATFRNLTAHMPAAGLDPGALPSTSDYMIGLPAGRRSVDTYYYDVRDIGPARAAILHQRPLSTAWRDLSDQAEEAVDELDLLSHRLLPVTYAENARILSRLLTEVRNGGTPCLDAFGRISPPSMPQQRRSPRRLLCQECHLRAGGREIKAFAKDVSAGGFGLERTPQLERGEPVILELSSGRVFHGTIAWSSGEASGVRLAAQLAYNDPLLSG